MSTKSRIPSVMIPDGELTPLHRNPSLSRPSSRNSLTRNPKPETRNSEGFTLLELLVVITIISMLAGLLLSGVMIARRKANEGAVKAFINALDIAVESYETVFGDFPPGDGGVDSAESLYQCLSSDALGHTPFSFKERQLVDTDGDGRLEICDHWKVPLAYYHYRNYDEGPQLNRFRILSVGTDGEDDDGAPGTDDITNWQ